MIVAIVVVFVMSKNVVKDIQKDYLRLYTLYVRKKGSRDEWTGYKMDYRLPIPGLKCIIDGLDVQFVNKSNSKRIIPSKTPPTASSKPMWTTKDYEFYIHDRTVTG
jgi:hypothetical protein